MREYFNELRWLIFSALNWKDPIFVSTQSWIYTDLIILKQKIGFVSLGPVNVICVQKSVFLSLIPEFGEISFISELQLYHSVRFKTEV